MAGRQFPLGIGMIDYPEVLAEDTIESFSSLSEIQLESLLEDHNRWFGELMEDGGEEFAFVRTEKVFGFDVEN